MAQRVLYSPSLLISSYMGTSVPEKNMESVKKKDSCRRRKNCRLDSGYAAIMVSVVLMAVPTTVYHIVL